MRSGLKLVRMLATAFIILASGQALLAQTGGGAGLRKEIGEGLGLIFQGGYDEAARRFEQLARDNPLSPAGDFYGAVALTWKSYVDAVKLEQGNRDNDAAIAALLASAITKA